MSSSLHIHIGGAGVKIGDMLWKLYEKEYNETTQKTYIYEEVDGNHYPQALFFDTDDRIIHEVQKNTSIKFKNKSFLHAKEDASTHCRGWYIVGDTILLEALDYIRKKIETMDRLEEIVITNSISGGTGSGFLCRLVYEITEYVKRKVKIHGFMIFPSSEMCNSTVEIYNTIDASQALIEYFHSITIFDNQSMYNVIDHQLGLDFVDYQHLNNVVSQIISSYTGLRRFNNSDNSKFLSNLCPYPYMHFLIPQYGQMTLINDYTRKELKQEQFIKFLSKVEQKLYQCPKSPNYIATALLFRQKQLNSFYGKFDLILKNFDHYFGQSPNIFQCQSSNYQVLPELAQMKQTGTFFSNDASIVSRFKLLTRKFDILYRKRAFVHWYVGQGQEANMLMEQRESFGDLIADYEDFKVAENLPIESQNDDEF
ncbi:unnamed protein product [Paramecium octaurelia]|uniref:Tubulin/FtsZ GTPase domain-containing protein n=1 Tax=Paramecium octaurelia TaxID=43137 RepID=A0A8S1YQN5_PAROT|nr:unnamed protein product [Paramecium octaurelia]